MAKVKSELTASQVLDVLSEKLWPKEAFAWMREVRNGTGWQRNERYADALVVSCWPSRGIYALGVEVKVSRSDWLHELKQPTKSAEIQKYCRHWWLATTPGIVHPGELPPTWGLVEVNSKASVITEAPKLDPEPPDWKFFASVFRNAGSSIEAQRTMIESIGYKRGREASEADAAELLEFRNNVYSTKRNEEKLADLQQRAKEFEDATGISMGGYLRNSRSAIAITKLAAKLSQTDLGYTADTLERSVSQIAGIVAGMREVSSMVPEDES